MSRKMHLSYPFETRRRLFIQEKRSLTALTRVLIICEIALIYPIRLFCTIKWRLLSYPTMGVMINLQMNELMNSQ